MTPTGLLGGSFNPAHRGHRLLSLAAARALALREVWWIISPGNPLKAAAKDMGPLRARLASARDAARRAPVRVTAIERDLGTRYTIDTLKKLVRRYPDRRFIWLMGADNLAQFHLWRDWRGIARIMPIAVVGRPGYAGRVRAARAMGWLRRFIRPPGRRKQWTDWNPPAILFLSLPLDGSSATATRAADPDWVRSLSAKPVRDMITHRLID